MLEATIIIIDNSEHSRNGDYLPTRFEAQSDAVNLIFSAKTQSNPESSVGLMTLSGSQPEVLTTLTSDFGKILDGLHRTKIHGSPHFSTALNVAQLALKHRQNKAQHQRVILFTCSPLVGEDSKSVVKLAKRLKKNTINVDVVAFGDLEAENTAVIEAFHENVKGSADGSHLAIIPAGPNLLSDSIVATPILAGDGVGGGGGGSGGEGGDAGGAGGQDQSFEFGVDPNTDPELALALRMSMEEEERRRQREEREAVASEAPKLESVPEEVGASGEAGSSSESKPDEKKDGDGKDEGGDKMDTA